MKSRLDNQTAHEDKTTIFGVRIIIIYAPIISHREEIVNG